MAAEEITGASPDELETLEGQYYNTPQYLDDGIPFELAYCLNPIAKQPDHYDGPQRFCKRRGANIDGESGKAGKAVCCHSHGGNVTAQGKRQAHRLENPATAAITHGAYAEDDHLVMDFDDDEQTLYDSIMEDWPDIYSWPPRSEDPARYRMLRRVAVNEVRSIRTEDYIDEDGEVHNEPVFDDQGVQVGEKEVENPLAREYRLLMSEITNQLRELGLTPKQQQKMDTLESEESANEAVTQIASDALDVEREYDPSEFTDNE
jgi:hypothetical protein